MQDIEMVERVFESILFSFSSCTIMWLTRESRAARDSYLSQSNSKRHQNSVCCNTFSNNQTKNE